MTVSRPLAENDGKEADGTSVGMSRGNVVVVLPEDLIEAGRLL